MEYKRARFSPRGTLASIGALAIALALVAPVKPRGKQPEMAPSNSAIKAIDGSGESHDEDSWRKLAESWSVVITGLATAVVAAFTWRLWKSTDQLWQEAKDSSSTATAAARAAQASVEALIAAERAYVFVEVREVTWPGVESLGVGSVEVQVKFWNYGKTPAVIKLIRGSLMADSAAPTKLISFRGSDQKLPPSLGIGANDSYEIQVHTRLDLKASSAVETGEHGFFCMGKIEYDDVMGQSHETGFCWHRVGDQYIVTRESPLNFRS